MLVEESIQKQSYHNLQDLNYAVPAWTLFLSDAKWKDPQARQKKKYFKLLLAV